MKYQAPILVKYEGPATDAGIDFAVVGKSFVGFDQLIKDLFSISKVNGTLEVRTEKIEHHSVDAFIHLYVIINGLPFDNAKHFFEFIQVVAPELLNEAKNACSITESLDDGLNTFFQNRPFDSWMISSYLVYLLGKHRGENPRDDNRIPDRVRQRIHSLYKANRFKRALAPLRESGYEKITVSQQQTSNANYTTITDQDLGFYLPEEDQILPFLHDGDSVTLRARVVGLNSTKGEVVTLKATELEKKPAIYHAFPPRLSDVSIYKNYFGQDVIVNAEVIRKNNNLYKKPEFNIISMEPYQTSLDLEERSNI